MSAIAHDPWLNVFRREALFSYIIDNEVPLLPMWQKSNLQGKHEAIGAVLKKTCLYR